MTFWKLFPPGWSVSELSGDYWGDGGDSGDGDGGGGGGDDGSGGGGGHDDDEHDGDGGNDREWEREQERQREREEEQRREEERRREEEERRRREEEERRRREEELRREEEERQRRLEEQRRQIEEQRRRMDEENQRNQQDLDGDGIPDPVTPGIDGTPDAQPSEDEGDDSLRQRFKDYVDRNQETFNAEDPAAREAWLKGEAPPKSQGFSTNDPAEMQAWLQQRAQDTLGNREQGRWYSPATAGPPYKGPTPTPTSILASAPPAPAPNTAPPPPPDKVPEIAATAAATATAQAGAAPEEVAQAAEIAAREASDHQSLAQQSAWTRAAFRSQYGPNAEAEWARQHNAELARNRQLYGASEPRTGMLPVGGAPSGTPPAPNRRIGATPPPAPGETGRYGINSPLPSLQAPANPAPAVPSARTAPPGTTSPSAVGSVPPAAPAAATPPPAPATPGTPVAAPSALPTPPPAPTAPIRRRPDEATPPPYTPPPYTPLPPSPPTTPGDGGYAPTPPSRVPETPSDFPASPGDGGVEPYKDVMTTDEYIRNGINPATGDIIEYTTGNPEPRTPDGRRIMSYVDPTPTGRFLTSTEPPREGRFTPERNIVRYDPITGQTLDGETLRGNPRYSYETLASQDTTIAPAPRRDLPETGADLSPVTPPPSIDPVRAAIDSDRPIDTLASLAAAGKGPGYDGSQDALHIANGIAGMLRGEADAAWAEPYLNDVARLAYAREERGKGHIVDPRDTPVEYVERWKDAFYGSDHNVPMVKEVDQQMIDYAAERTPPGKAFRWQDAFGPTGEKGLISQQVTDVDCGTNAFSTVLRSRGYNADPAATFAFGRQRGYHDGNQFQGPGAMVNMVRNEAGLDAKQVTLDEGGWAQVDKELAAGRPVMLSSPGHWWVVSAKNDQGQYYAGATALRGNPQWMPRGGFRYGGAANTAVLVTGDQISPDAPAVKAMGLKPPQMGPKNTRAALSSQTTYQGPAERATTRVASEMSNSTKPAGDLPPILASAKPREGLVAGQAEPVDQMARVWQRASDQTGDRNFADGLSALLIGEGGLQGGAGDRGQSHGVFQFYWGGGEGNGFEAWLRNEKGFKGTTADAQRMAKDIDLATEYYIPRVKSFYDKGTNMGYTNPVQAIAAGGHNAGAVNVPSVWKNYQDAWDNWKAGNPTQKNTVQSGSASANPTQRPDNTLMMRQSLNEPADSPTDTGGAWGFPNNPPSAPPIMDAPDELNQIHGYNPPFPSPPGDRRVPGEFPYDVVDREGADRSNDSLFSPPGVYVPDPPDDNILMRQGLGGPAYQNPSDEPAPDATIGQYNMEQYLANPANWDERAFQTSRGWGQYHPLPEGPVDQEERWGPNRAGDLPNRQQSAFTPEEAAAIRDAATRMSDDDFQSWWRWFTTGR